MSDSIRQALGFLINTVFDLYIFILVVRIILAWVGANYFDPITQFIIRLTDFVIKPIRRFIPNIKRIETSSIVLVFLLELIRFFLLTSLAYGFPNPIGLLIMAFADVLKLVIQTLFYAILLQALLSWIQPNSPMNRTLYLITSPIMMPLRRVIPIIGGMDITPIPAMIILQILLIILINPLMAMGLGVAIG
jgi:YggT family protein